MMHLCANCLGDGAVPVPVGRETGPQRDPIRASIELCGACTKALVDGDLPGFHERYNTERTVRRSDGQIEPAE